MNVGIIIRDAFIKGFLDPTVLKVWFILILFVLFIAILRGLANRVFKKYENKRAKTSTLIIIEISIVIIGIIVWII